MQISSKVGLRKSPRYLRIYFVLLFGFYVAVSYYLFDTYFTKSITNFEVSDYIASRRHVVNISTHSDLALNRTENWKQIVLSSQNEPWKQWGFLVPDKSYAEIPGLKYWDRSKDCNAIRNLQVSWKQSCVVSDINVSALPVLDTRISSIMGNPENSAFDGICLRQSAVPNLDAIALSRYVSERATVAAGKKFKERLADGDSFVGRYDRTRFFSQPKFDLLIVPNGYVANNGLVWDCKRKIINTNVCSPFLVSEMKNLTLEMEDSPARHFETIVVVDQTHAEQYFHFMIETMPKVSLIPEEYLKDEKAMIFLQSNASFVQNMMFKAWGKVPQHRVIYGEVGKIYHANRVVYLKPSSCHIPTSYTLLKLRWDVFQNLQLPTTRTPELQDSIVFIDRGADADRSIANQLQLLHILTERYPDERVVIYPPTASFEDTIKIFSRAKVIIGAHGAGLSNMMFSYAGTAVLEFMISKQLLCYHDLAASLGMMYSTFQPEDAHWRSKDMHVDPESFAKVMDNILMYTDSPLAYRFPWASNQN